MNLTKISRTVSLLIVTIGLAVNGYSQSFLTNGLVAYYPFNGNANDESGNGNNGAINGTDMAYSFDRFGDPKSLYLNSTSTPSLAFNGTYVTAPRSLELDFDKDFTLSVWAFLKSGTSNDFAQNLISNGLDGNTNVNLRVFNYAVDTGGQDILQFLWYASKNGLEHVFSVVPLVRDTWWQAIVVRSGTNVSLYRNGSFLASALMTPTKNSSEMWLGNHAGLNYGLVGGIDDVRMYNRALSLSEVQQLYETENKCIPHPAMATATVVNGFVVAINITGRGCGYTNAPLVEIRGGGGSGAAASATVSNGVVTDITITDAGIGYTNTPTVKIASPPFMPWLVIAVSKMKVTQHILLGKNYLLVSSTDLKTWSRVGSQFTAEDESVTLELDVDVVGRYFRIQEVQ